MAERRVAVVGGGITGLSAAYELAHGAGLDGDVDVVVLEAGDRFGGKIHTAPFAGRPVDEAADAFLARVPDAVELCRQLGLADQLVTPAARNAYLYSLGRAAPVPRGTGAGRAHRPRRAGHLRRGVDPGRAAGRPGPDHGPRHRPDRFGPRRVGGRAGAAPGGRRGLRAPGGAAAQRRARRRRRPVERGRRGAGLRRRRAQPREPDRGTPGPAPGGLVGSRRPRLLRPGVGDRGPGRCPGGRPAAGGRRPAARRPRGPCPTGRRGAGARCPQLRARRRRGGPPARRGRGDPDHPARRDRRRAGPGSPGPGRGHGGGGLRHGGPGRPGRPSGRHRPPVGRQRLPGGPARGPAGHGLLVGVEQVGASGRRLHRHPAGVGGPRRRHPGRGPRATPSWSTRWWPTWAPPWA